MPDYMYAAPVTAKQLEVGELLGLDLSQDTWAVARARILDLVGTAINREEPYDQPTAKQIAWARSLGIDVTEQSYRVAYAMIQDALWERENQLIRQMKLRPGDTVAREREYDHEGEIQKRREEFVVSSISENGRLYFKGTGSKSGWPSQFTKIDTQDTSLDQGPVHHNTESQHS